MTMLSHVHFPFTFAKNGPLAAFAPTTSARTIAMTRTLA